MKPLLLLIYLNLLPLLFSAQAEELDFNRDVRPILSQRCFACHGPDDAKIEGNLQLHTFELATRKRGKNGAKPAAIIPGNASASIFWKRITTDDPDDIMPPPKTHQVVTATERKILKKWINNGAKYEKLWSFKKLPERITIPKTNSSSGNPIDAFILEQLKAKKLTPLAQTQPEVLLRRLYFTLTGLPPTKQQVEAFLTDPSKKAYEKIVDQLLTSRAHAEHLTSEWMDVSRYADSYGYQVDRSRTVWPWKNWVLNSFNTNMSYDTFILHQLAGDLIPNSDDQSKIATTFNRLHMQKVEGGSKPEEFKAEYVADRVHTAGTAFMGLTMECSRCHDHKFDPISTKDYYSMSGFFNNIDEEGLYSFFTSAVPSPSMAIRSDKEKEEDVKIITAIKKIEDDIKKIIPPKGLTKPLIINPVDIIANYDFTKVKGHKIASTNGVKIPASFSPKYNKLLPSQGIELDGDSSIDIKAVPLIRRYHPFSVEIDLTVPKTYKRASIWHTSRGRFDAGSRGYELSIISGKLQLALVHFSPGNEIRVESKETIPTAKRIRITSTYDGSSKATGLKLYIDGKAIPTSIIKNHLTKKIVYDNNKPVALKIGARFRDNGAPKTIIHSFTLAKQEWTEAEIARTITSEEVWLAHAKERHSKEFKTKNIKLMEKRKELAHRYDLYRHLMIMKDIPSARKTYVLEGGFYNKINYDQEVLPAPPSKVYPFDSKLPRNRLGFAKWLLAPKHPLTSRVTVNRYWQMIFQRGIVNTSNDFGYQGSYPSHPELLDYLARHFVDSGWDLRNLFKLIVTSDTFKRSSNATPELLEKDNANIFLARGPSYFMTAEMIKDSAFAISSSLSSQFGGATIDETKPVNNKYRRSVYSNWKRNSPSPSMLIFGTPRRQVCSVKREKTTTPLQPLVMLNNPQLVESAKLMALKLVDLKSDQKRIQYAFLSILSRHPHPKEQELIKQLIKEQRNYFTNNRAEAKKYINIGKIKQPVLDSIETAAWTVTVNALMNLDSYYLIR